MGVGLPSLFWIPSKHVKTNRLAGSRVSVMIRVVHLCLSVVSLCESTTTTTTYPKPSAIWFLSVNCWCTTWLTHSTLLSIPWFGCAWCVIRYIHILPLPMLSPNSLCSCGIVYVGEQLLAVYYFSLYIELYPVTDIRRCWWLCLVNQDIFHCVIKCQWRKKKNPFHCGDSLNRYTVIIIAISTIVNPAHFNH